MPIDQLSNALTSILYSFVGQDTVAVYAQDFEQVFRGARAIKAVVKENSKLMEHPVENGTVITDHRIIEPVEIELSMILTPASYQDTYAQVRQYYLDAAMLVVQTRSGVYANMMIQSMPHEEDTNLFNTITLAITLKEVQFVMAQYASAPRNPKNTSTSPRGAQQAKPTPEAPRTTTAQDAAKWFRGLFS